MDLETYRELINEFYESTAIDKPPQAAIDSWFDHLSSYSLQVLSGALNRLKTELARRPFNMLFTIKESIIMFMKENPEMVNDPEYGECAECNGEGIFFVKYASNGDKEKRNSAIILCGSCENWRKKYGSTQGKLRMKKFEAEYQGYEIQK